MIIYLLQSNDEVINCNKLLINFDQIQDVDKSQVSILLPEMFNLSTILIYQGNTGVRARLLADREG